MVLQRDAKVISHPFDLSAHALPQLTKPLGNCLTVKTFENIGGGLTTSVRAAFACVPTRYHKRIDRDCVFVSFLNKPLLSR